MNLQQNARKNLIIVRVGFELRESVDHLCRMLGLTLTLPLEIPQRNPEMLMSYVVIAMFADCRAILFPKEVTECSRYLRFLRSGRQSSTRGSGDLLHLLLHFWFLHFNLIDDY